MGFEPSASDETLLYTIKYIKLPTLWLVYIQYLDLLNIPLLLFFEIIQKHWHVFFLFVYFFIK